MVAAEQYDGRATGLCIGTTQSNFYVSLLPVESPLASFILSLLQREDLHKKYDSMQSVQLVRNLGEVDTYNASASVLEPVVLPLNTGIVERGSSLFGQVETTRTAEVSPLPLAVYLHNWREDRPKPVQRLRKDGLPWGHKGTWVFSYTPPKEMLQQGPQCQHHDEYLRLLNNGMQICNRCHPQEPVSLAKNIRWKYPVRPALL